MADTLKVSGSIQLTPPGSPSLQLSPGGDIDETLQVSRHTEGIYVLAAAVDQVVSLGGLTAAHFASFKIEGNEIKLKLTTGEGADQVIPVESFLVIATRTSPLTAIKATGTGTLHVLLAQE